MATSTPRSSAGEADDVCSQCGRSFDTGHEIRANENGSLVLVCLRSAVP